MWMHEFSAPEIYHFVADHGPHNRENWLRHDHCECNIGLYGQRVIAELVGINIAEAVGDIEPMPRVKKGTLVWRFDS